METSPPKRNLLWVNLLGGTAVLASYAHGFMTHPASSGDLWGQVPEAIRPFYVISMLLAMVGYFAFTYFVFVHVDPQRTRIANRFGFNLFYLLYLAILLPSALWMPLTFAMLEQPSSGLWLAIRWTLAVVGLGSVGLVGTLLTLRPRRPAWAYWLAVGGSLAFTVQTALLDALVWPIYFPH